MLCSLGVCFQFKKSFLFRCHEDILWDLSFISFIVLAAMFKMFQSRSHPECIFVFGGK